MAGYWLGERRPEEKQKAQMQRAEKEAVDEAVGMRRDAMRMQVRDSCVPGKCEVGLDMDVESGTTITVSVGRITSPTL